jgi:hypothetical protein
VRKKTGFIGFGVLTAVTIKGTVFWVVKPCILLEDSEEHIASNFCHLFSAGILLSLVFDPED